MRYEDLSERQKAYICNGCGGKGGWIVPPKAIFFKASCNHHDYGHWKGYTEDDRQKSNAKLFCAMRSDVKQLPWYKRAFYWPWVFLYWAGVEVCSWKFFHYADRPRRVEDFDWGAIFRNHAPDEIIPWQDYLKRTV